MAKFVVEPHFRLHEWVAEEKGYFKAEGLDYEFRELVRTTAGQIHATPDRVARQRLQVAQHLQFGVFDVSGCKCCRRFHRHYG